MKQQRNEEIQQIGTSLQPDDSPHFPSLTSSKIDYYADENSISKFQIIIIIIIKILRESVALPNVIIGLCFT